MNPELNQPESLPGQTAAEMTPQQQVVEAAMDLAVVAIEASQDQDERHALVDKVKTKLGATGILVHDLEDQPTDERRGRSGLTRDEVLWLRKTGKSRNNRVRARYSRLGRKT